MCMCIYDYVLILLIADIDIVDVNTNYIWKEKIDPILFMSRYILLMRNLSFHSIIKDSPTLSLSPAFLLNLKVSGAS